MSVIVFERSELSEFIRFDARGQNDEASVVIASGFCTAL